MVFDGEDLELVRAGEISRLQGPVGALIFYTDPTGAAEDPALYLAVGSGQTVQLWNVTDASSPRAVDEPMTCHLGVVRSLWLDSDHQTLFSAALDQSVIRWKLGPKGPLARALVHLAQQPKAIAFSRDEGILATVCKGEGEIILWYVGHASKDGTANYELTRLSLIETGEPVVSLSFSPDGTLLATGDTLGNVRFWRKDSSVVESPTFREVARASIPAHKGRVNGLAWDPYGRFVISFGEYNEIYRWSTDDLSRPIEPLPIAFPTKISALALHPRGSHLAVADWDRAIHILKLTIDGDIEQTWVLRGHVGAVLALDFSPDGKFLASGGMDGLVYLWDDEMRQHGPPLCGHNRPVVSVKFSPVPTSSVHWLVTASRDEDSNLMLWNVPATHRQIPQGSSLVGHCGGVVIADFRPLDDSTIPPGMPPTFTLATIGEDRMSASGTLGWIHGQRPPRQSPGVRDSTIGNGRRCCLMSRGPNTESPELHGEDPGSCIGLWGTSHVSQG
ncbi:MAG: WD40 repeat domain-containing protein [Isosphaeraceae bacterium]